MTTQAGPTASTRGTLLEFLRKQYLGPANGPDEDLRDRPDRVYLVGTLYPRGEAAPNLDGDELGDDVHDEALDDSVELANAWHPASAAISFLHDGDLLTCNVSGAHYARDAGKSWQRAGLTDVVHISRSEDEPARQTVLDGRARLFSVWRPLGGAWLVTVAIENSATHEDPSSPPPTEDCLFQIHLECQVGGGEVLPYPSSSNLSDDPEDAELRLLYRDKRVYGAGHGCSVTWKQGQDGKVTTVSTEMMPATVVPGVNAGGAEARVREMSYLADETVPVDHLRAELFAFVEAYRSWVEEQRRQAADLAVEHRQAADRLLVKMDAAVQRMEEGVTLLTADDELLLAFRLANSAMRDQFLQTEHIRRSPGAFRKPLEVRPPRDEEPSWKPFQLAFQLLAIPSTCNPTHADRELVDLIWFPTGGGKTEAYLGLAAFEMIRRRLTRATRGGGTAVLTRYTLRLLTAQQLQRAATLICALERLRASHPALADKPSFSIGLWVGGETTPNSFEQALETAKDLRKAQRPESPFQVQSCPWCGTRLFPERRLQDDDAYGVRATRLSFELFCPHSDCPFHAELPLRVVDEQIFQDPPTMVVATVDKFARLPWVGPAGAILGRANVPFDPPSLVIQDELHLLSGPLGSTVALYESAIQAVLGWDGTQPKIVASTATIRAANHQVRSLYGRDVVLFPPSGLTADDSFYAKVDTSSAGRLYVGIMPQAHSQSFATVLTCAALLQAPAALELQGPALDAYWTLVAYHNSLRELGRTVTIARDDVEGMLRARDSGEGSSRQLRRDGVIELTSNVEASQLLQFLARLERGVDTGEAVDLVATTNMLSVGIDISRLGVMLMNGQPKTTSEYIQATSRVGRATVPGLVITLLRASKPRDRSHYEGFRGYHEAFYRHVEPTSVTPWSLASRDRSLHAALTILIRHGCGLRDNLDAGSFRRDDPAVKKAIDVLSRTASAADPDEAAEAASDLRRLAGDWDRRAREAEALGSTLRYQSTGDEPALLRDFGQARDGWETMHSMRSVDRQVRVLAIGESLG